MASKVLVFLLITDRTRRIVVKVYARGAGLMPVHHAKDIKTGRFALLSLVLGINKLGNQLAWPESV